MNRIQRFIPPTPTACPTCGSALNPHVAARVDLQTDTLIYDGILGPHRIPLTSAEATLTSLLLRPGVQSYDTLIAGQWGALPCGNEQGVLKVLISRIRKKLQGSPLSIYTHYERGYQLTRSQSP